MVHLDDDSAENCQKSGAVVFCHGSVMFDWTINKLTRTTWALWMACGEVKRVALGPEQDDADQWIQNQGVARKMCGERVKFGCEARTGAPRDEREDTMTKEQQFGMEGTEQQMSWLRKLMRMMGNWQQPQP